MKDDEFDIGDAGQAASRARPRKAALDALERLLRAQVALSAHRTLEGAYGILRPARDDEIPLIEAVFLHCGVPLPDTLRTIYRRTLGVGNPVSPLPVLAVPFLHAALPDEGFGPPQVGIEAFEAAFGVYRDQEAQERPPFLHLGHAAPLGLTVSRNGLWSLEDYQDRREPPQGQEFGLVFEAAFVTYVEQVLLLWANDLAGAPLRTRDLDLTRDARGLKTRPAALDEAMAVLLAPRALSPRSWGEVEPLGSADLLRVTRREPDAEGLLAGHVSVVGLPYSEDPEAAERIGLGAALRLRPVDDNPHDPAAVEVWLGGRAPVRVGFVSRQEAPGVRALPGGPDAWQLRVVGRSERVIFAALEVARPEIEDEEAAREDSAPEQLPSGAEDLFSQKI